MQTALYHAHLSLGAKMTLFSGWEMPLHYGSMIQEHLNVRQAGGIFDLSHMGVMQVEGKEAEPYLNYLSSNQITGKKNGSATYTLFCTSRGTCAEDLLLYKETEERFFLVVNACNREKVAAHLQQQASGYAVHIRDRFQNYGILSVQGPKADALLSTWFPMVQQLTYMHFCTIKFYHEEVLLAQTGYTGEKGYELFASNRLIMDLWNQLIMQGGKMGIGPAGLGARDTLRLEMGYALYGHELDETIYPTETVAHWAVKLSKPDFLGKEPLLDLETSPKKRKELGVILQGKGIARAGFPVFKEGEQVGKVTSGAFSPSLNCPIALLLLEKNLCEGDSVDIQIRENRIRADIVPLPFFKHEIH